MGAVFDTADTVIDMQPVTTRAEVASAISELLAELGFTWSPGDAESIHVFDDLGFDSFDGYELVTMLEDRFEVPSAPEDFAATFTMRSIIDVVSSKIGAT